MAHGMNPSGRGVAALVFVVMAAAGVGPGRAQPLGDPMKPPAILSAGPAVPRAEADVPDEPVLQSTILSKGRRIAMIDGKPLGVGDRIGAARVIAIGPASVTLREGPNTRVLRLYRGVDISNAGAAPAPSKGSKEGTR